MTKELLNKMQTPFKDKYGLNPLTAQTKLAARAVLGADITCTNKIGNYNVETGMHPGVGGSLENICPATVFLDSLAACAGIVMGAVATHMGMEIRSGAVCVEGDLDLRGTLGVADNVEVGFKEIRMSVDIDTDASKQEINTLLRMTEKYCVVYQTLAKPPKIHLGLNSKKSKCDKQSG
jgi:uncharacterized OsmC-like protein